VSLQQRALLMALPLALAAVPLPRGAAAAATVDPGALAHCAAITGADERLACYDTLARPKPSPAAAANPAPASAKASAHAATAPAATTTTASAAPTRAAAATAAPAAAAAGTAAAGATAGSANSFGLTKHAAPEPGSDHIQAHVTRVDANRLGNVRISLDNGQVWTYNDPDALIRVGDAVTIKRGALGSFLLATPAHHTYKAQRSQ
jgi:hypothetical protein